jgi:uncharacterized protein (TIGR00251 family)
LELDLRIFVRVKPGAKVDKVEKVDETHYNVWVKSPAKEGKANESVIELLADFFNLPKSRIKIISGHSSRNKVFEVE